MVNYEYIIIGVGITCLIFGICSLIYSNRLNKNNTNKDVIVSIRVNNYLYIGVVFIILSVLSVIGYFYILHYYKNIAGRILELGKLDTEESKIEYFDLCDKLFLSQSPKETYDQFLDMKKSRPEKEVINLCGNFAKTIINK